MRDFSEFRRQWRPLAASVIGMGSALSLNSYVLSAFAPELIADLGWSRSEMALMGLPQFLLLIFVPLAGRLADLYGVRRVAAVGAAFYPISLVAIAMMNGDLLVYLAINVAQMALCATTTSTIYSRLAVENFATWRGLALALCGSGPAIVAMFGSPAITAFTQAHGWRAGYLAVAGFCAAGSLLTFLLMSRSSAAPRPAGSLDEKPRSADIYRLILRSRVFWLMLAGSFLVNIPHALVTSQLKLLVLEQGVTPATAGMLLSVFAVGVTIGRFASGLALDYLPSHIVAGVGLGLPLPGLLLLASSNDSTGVLVAAILFLGLSFGSEGDVIAYLVMRYFGIGVFSTVLGLLTAAIATAMASGMVILGIVLSMTDSFNPYLLLASGAVLVGSCLFLLLGRHATEQMSSS